MSTLRELPLAFNPRTGRPLAARDWHASEFRFKGEPWLYNPWNGERRPREQVRSDPWGVFAAVAPLRTRLRSGAAQ